MEMSFACYRGHQEGGGDLRGHGCHIRGGGGVHRTPNTKVNDTIKPEGWI